MKHLILPCLLPFVLLSGALSAQAPAIMSAADLARFDQPTADARIAYGTEALQFGDLRLPDGEGPHPVVVFVHGGCWLSEYDISHSSKLTAAFAANGIASWSLEYRRVGDAGGGWPGTFQDIAAGADHLREIAALHQLDLDRVIFAGHSAGAQMALWLAARPQLPASTLLASPEPLRALGVLALAPAADLRYLHEQAVCGEVIDKLMGGSPAQFPVRYRQTDPSLLAPIKLPQRLLIGKHDENWAPVGMRYADIAQARGGDVQLIEAPESGHFEMIDPDSSTWPLVIGAARELLAVDQPAAVPSGPDEPAQR